MLMELILTIYRLMKVKSMFHLMSTRLKMKLLMLFKMCRKEQRSVSSDDVISDGGIIRVINNIKDFDKIKNELREAQNLAEKYQNELEFLRWGRRTESKEIIAKSPEMKKVY